MRRFPRPSAASSGFTLVELLVVIGIIAVLISILLPSLNKARQSATTVKNLSNLRQLGIGLELYRSDNRGLYPPATDEFATPKKKRWADLLFPYMQNTEVYMSPAMSEEVRMNMRIAFVHTLDSAGNETDQTVYHGGYGYNYQYLGNGRTLGGTIRPYSATAKDVRASSQTVAIADTNGSRDGLNVFEFKHGLYTIDPPLGSVNYGSKGSRKNANGPGSGNSYYREANDESPNGTPGKVFYRFRSTPADRNGGKIAAVFCDGHAQTLTPAELDDSNGDGVIDNGYWTGRGDPDPAAR